MAGNEEAESNNIEIIISSSDPDLNHMPVLFEDTSAKGSLPPHDQIDKFRELLYRCALEGGWDWHHEIFWVNEGEYLSTSGIYDKYPGLVHIPLTANGDTALHVAAGANRIYFVRELVKSKHVTPQDLELTNSDGNTALCVAALTDEADRDHFRCMIKKNRKVALVRGQDGLLPVHLAALKGQRETVEELLSSKEIDLLVEMDYKDTQRLFLITISNVMYDVAKVLFAKYPNLATARDDDWVKALHMLPARKPSRKFYKDMQRLNLVDDPELEFLNELEFLKTVWSHVTRLEYKATSELTYLTSPVLFDAVKSGKVDAVKWFLSTNKDLMLLKDNIGRVPLHVAVKYRQHSIVNFILQQQRTVMDQIIWAVDNDGNNILHFAASYDRADEASSRRLNAKMEGELAWFKEMEKRVPPKLITMRNSQDETPRDKFEADHEGLSDKVKEEARGIANSGMVAAALIAAIAFAAALTVPGDKNNAWFVVFILTNALALFTSSASIISFLSIFTSLSNFISSWLTHKEIFNISRRLIVLGLGLLFVSVFAMVIAFVAASFLIFGHIFKWVAYVVASMGVLPTLMLLVIQYNYLIGLLHKFFRSIFRRNVGIFIE